MNVLTRVESLRRAAAESRGRSDLLRQEVVDRRREAAEARKAASVADDARAVLKALGDLKQAEVSGRVEGLVTRALRSVFGRDDYAFRFDWEEKRGVATATPVLESSFGGEALEADVIDGHGGGVKDVLSFVLRFLVLRLTPGLRPLIFLDEPFRQVSANHAEGVGTLLTMLARRTKSHIIFITHSEKLAGIADRVYRVELDEGGKSIVTEDTSA